MRKRFECLIRKADYSNNIATSFSVKQNEYGIIWIFITESTNVKIHGSVSVDALQRKVAEESACCKLHDPALLCNFWWKMEITDLLGLSLEMSLYNFVEIFLE